MMSNSVPECEKDNLTGCVSFYTQWIDICVCIRVRGLHLVFFRGGEPQCMKELRQKEGPKHFKGASVSDWNV